MCKMAAGTVRSLLVFAYLPRSWVLAVSMRSNAVLGRSREGVLVTVVGVGFEVASFLTDDTRMSGTATHVGVTTVRIGAPNAVSTILRRIASFLFALAPVDTVGDLTTFFVGKLVEFPLELCDSVSLLFDRSVLLTDNEVDCLELF